MPGSARLSTFTVLSYAVAADSTTTARSLPESWHAEPLHFGSNVLETKDHPLIVEQSEGATSSLLALFAGMSSYEHAVNTPADTSHAAAVTIRPCFVMS
jgi:hypothetical protein